MQRLDDKTLEPAKILPIIFVIDTSGSMAGHRIAMLNEAMRELFEVLCKQPHFENTDIRINVLSYSSECEWMFDKMRSVDTLYWQDLHAGMLTDLGAALKELNKELNCCSLFVDGYQHTSFPIIVFISDGCSTDDWENPLSELMDNHWFRYGCKLAFLIGEDADVQCFTKLTGSKETVLTLDTERPELLNVVAACMRAFWQIEVYDVVVHRDRDKDSFDRHNWDFDDPDW